MGSFEKDADKHVRKGKKEAAQIRRQVAALQAEQASTDSQSQARGGAAVPHDEYGNILSTVCMLRMIGQEVGAVRVQQRRGERFQLLGWPGQGQSHCSTQAADESHILQA